MKSPDICNSEALPAWPESCPAFPVPLPLQQHIQWGGTRCPEADPCYSEFKNLAGCLSLFSLRILGSCSFGNWDMITAPRCLAPCWSPLHTSHELPVPRAGSSAPAACSRGGRNRFRKNRTSNLASVRTRAPPRLTLPVHFE